MSTAGRTKKPITLPSHLFIKQFLDNRAAAGRALNDVAGEERKTLMSDLWPLLSQRQRNSYGNIESRRYYKWLTDTMASVREHVIQPKKCNNRFETSRRDNPGDANNFTKAFQAAKNQQTNIKDSKDKHERNNPGRMRKHHGTIAKKTQQRKYRKSPKGMATEAAAWQRRKQRRRDDRDKTLWEEHARRRGRGQAKLTPADFDRLTNKVYHQPGKIVKEFPHLSLYECVQQKKVIPYVGLATWEDRMVVEPWRFLCDTKEQNRSILQWQLDPSTPMTKITLEEAKHLLGFKCVTVYKRAAKCGFEAYMVERTLMGEIDHFEIGKQRFNRVTGAGKTYRGKKGFYHVFITYALTEHLKQFPALVIVPNAQKEED